MMIINKRTYISFATSIAFLILVISVCSAFRESDATINEENYVRLNNKHIKPIADSGNNKNKPDGGGNNNLNEAPASSHLLSPSKVLSNKEVVFGEDDDEVNEKNEPATTTVSATKVTKPTALSMARLVKKDIDSSKDSINSDALEFGDLFSVKQSEHGGHPKSIVNSQKPNELIEDILVDDLKDIIVELERKQRIDHLNKNHDYEKMRKFHNSKSLQRKLQEELDRQSDADYEEALLKSLLEMDALENELSEQYEAKMNLNEIGPSLPSFNKPKNKFPFKTIKNDNNMMDMFNQLDTNEKQTHNEKLLDNKKNKQPVKLVDVKEQIVIEENYNRNLKNQANNKPSFKFSSSSLSGSSDPFADTDIIDNINGQGQQLGDADKQLIEQANRNNLNSPANSIDSLPSMAQKHNNFNHDPNLSAKIEQIRKQNDYLFTFIVAGLSIAGAVALLAAGFCWYTIHKNAKATANIDYETKAPPAFNTFSSSSSGSVKSKTSTGDRRLAQSAQMYHYQHQKQQIIAMEKAGNDIKPDDSDNSEGETEEGDYTVYECPGLAPTGEMEVKNPLFKEEFSASSNNINSSLSSLPPPYSALSQPGQIQPSQQFTTTMETNESTSGSRQETVASIPSQQSVTIPINENKNSQQTQ